MIQLAPSNSLDSEKNPDPLFRRLTSYSLRRQLNFTVLATAFVCFLIVIATVVISDYRFARQTLLNSLTTLAETLAETSTAAVMFNDAEVAKAILASLKVDDAVVAAKLSNADGVAVAEYYTQQARPSMPDRSLPDRALHEIVDGYAYVAAPIRLNGKLVGAVRIVSETRKLQQRLWNLGGLALLLTFGTFGLALTMTALLTKPLLGRINQLVRVSQIISNDNDYSLRVRPQGGDEVFYLMRQFNDMLDNIQQRDWELRQTRDTLTRRAKELERSNAELEQFAYVSSHDLKEPLRTVISYLELLRVRYSAQLDERARDYMDRTVLATQHMNRLIQALLDFSRIGRSDQRKDFISLQELVRAVVKNSAESIRQTGAKIECHDVSVLYGFPTDLIRLFQNLVENALKYRRPNVPPHVVISAEPGINETIIHVADNGIGIESKYFDKIFVVFQRLEGIRAAEGTGIGLAICKKIAELHGGKIWLTSLPNVGTTFHIALPTLQSVNADLLNESSATAHREAC